MASAAQEIGASSDNTVRKDLVQVFFGLVLTQIAVYITSLVEIWKPGSMDYWAAWSHLILSFVLTTASWFGWQGSVRKSKFDEEASIFQWAYFLSVVDIILVGLYFLLVHQVEVANVNAFPSAQVPEITRPSARPETVIVLIVFVVYAVWDSTSSFAEGKPYGPWPSIVCGLLVLPAFCPIATARGESILVILMDVYLIGVILLFRALKRLQKWNIKNRVGHPTFNFLGVPFKIWVWLLFCTLLCIAGFAGALMVG